MKSLKTLNNQGFTLLEIIITIALFSIIITNSYWITLNVYDHQVINQDAATIVTALFKARTKALAEEHEQYVGLLKNNRDFLINTKTTILTLGSTTINTITFTPEGETNGPLSLIITYKNISTTIVVQKNGIIF